jgi:mannosyltransferase OCH1-like enzyme
MPEVFADFGRKWEDQGWRVKDWVDSKALPPLTNQSYFDRAKEFYPDDWKRFQADLLRLELIYLYGGVYVDTDVEPLRPLDELLEGRECVVGRSPQSLKGYRAITNAFIAAIPGHEFLKACMVAVPSSAENFSQHHLAMSVGPWMLDRVNNAGDYEITVVEDLFTQGWFTHHWNSAKRRRGQGMDQA